MIGEPAYEVANAMCNPSGPGFPVPDPSRMRRRAEIYAEALHLDPARILAYAFVHASLSACWSMEDGEDGSHAMQCGEVLGAMM